MFRSLMNFFRSLFGGSPQNEPTEPQIPETGNEPAAPPAAPSPPKTEVSPPKKSTETATQSTPGKAQTAPHTGGMTLLLKRGETAEKDVLGKLSLDGEFCCHTIEGPDPMPAGNYALSLRVQGGLHATYAYKYGDMHKGLIMIKGTSRPGFPFIRTGNTAQDSEGGIVVGDSAKEELSPREVWNSDVAYRKLYPKVAEKLAAGEKVILTISE